MVTPDTATFLVGWIAALKHELAAARCMLDEEFDEAPEDFSPPSSDSNTYTWGRIGRHNVVITSLPEGIYGPSAATQVASRLSASLPHLRFGLMVGIGAGVATKDNDIRLGDVVVSKPTGTTGGVVQYDSRKAKADEEERHDERIGSLAKPPTVLLGALAKLGSTLEMGDSRVPAILSKVFEARPKMRKTFGYPGAAKDPLRSEILAQEDDERRNSPEIHLGIIASGHTLLKSAEERDRILEWLEKESVRPLCFEMEAAGLMDTFPCLIIRGICDYADEKKNDDWQRYAALTAACFAKELLANVDAGKVPKEHTLQQHLGQIEHKIQQIEDNTTFSYRHARNEDFEKLLECISSDDYSARLHDVKKRHHAGTAQWVLSSSEYNAWVEGSSEDASSSRTLFCYGHQGAGKTTVCALVVQDLLNRINADGQAALYVFFNFKQREIQDSEHVMATILRQLLRAKRCAPKEVTEMLEQHQQNNTSPGLDELHQALKETLANMHAIYLVLDALDECRRNALKIVAGRLRDVMRVCHLRLLVTSRQIPEVEALFPADVRRFEIRASALDLTLYARSRANAEFHTHLAQNASIVQRVINRVVEVSAGIFLLARLIMDNLADQDTLADMDNALETIPYGEHGLQHMHEKALERILDQPARRAHRALEALVWVVYGKQLLQRKALEHALAFDSEDTKFSAKNIIPIDVVVSQCAGLLSIDGDDNLVRVIHQSTQVYLQDSLPSWVTYSPHLLLASKCLTYATFDEMDYFSVDCIPPDLSFPDPPYLYDYAVHFWVYHAGDVEGQNKKGELARLHTVLKRLKTKPHVMNKKRSGSTSWHVMADQNSVQLYQTLMELLGHQRPRDSQGRTPLHRAAIACSLEIACLLAQRSLNDSANSYAAESDRSGATPLWYATKRGDVKMISVLLNAGNPEMQMRERNEVHRTPLHLAAETGQDEIAALLLYAINDARTANIFESEPSPLSIAAEKCHKAIVRMFLSAVKSSLNLNAAILSASRRGNDTGLELLLAARGADANSIGSRPDWLVDAGCTSLSLYLAARSGYERTVRLLLNQPDIDVNRRSENGSTLLHRAIYGAPVSNNLLKQTNGSYDGTVNALLDKGNAEANVRDRSGLTPLSLAAMTAQATCAKMILAALSDSPEEYDHALVYAYAVTRVQEKMLHMMTPRSKGPVEQHTLQDIGAIPSNAGWVAALEGLSHTSALALYLYMTDYVICRSCGSGPLHSGFHCKTCLNIPDALKCYDFDHGLPIREELYTATNICSDCVRHGSLQESISLYLRGCERGTRQGSVLDGTKCGVDSEHPLLWVDATPLLQKGQMEDFVAPYEVPPITQDLNPTASREYRAKIEEAEEAERRRMDASLDYWRSFEFRRCEFLNCDEMNGKHSEWCLRETGGKQGKSPQLAPGSRPRRR